MNLKMIMRLPFLLIVGFIIIPSWVNAQNSTQNKFLREVGILDSVYSNILKESREIYIQLPSSFSPDKNQKYPVAFILDGEVFLPTVSDVQNYYSGGFMPEMVLVGVSNSKNRIRDLTTSKIKVNYGMPFNEVNGEADTFIKFIENELIPFIDKKYPVTNHRTLIGHSYGGLFTLYTFLHHTHLFANYLAIDPSLDWDEQKLLKEAQGVLDHPKYADKSLFVSLSGQLHMQDPRVTIDNVMKDTTEFTLFARSNIAFANMARQNAKDRWSFEWKFYPKDLHGTVPFPSILDGLIFNFDWYQMENTYTINTPASSMEELYAIVNYRAKKLEDHFGYAVPPYPEDLFNALGYMSLDGGQEEKAQMFFEFAMEFYPNSANAFDSMSEYYERIGDYPSALKYARNAYALSNTDYYYQKVQKLKKK